MFDKKCERCGKKVNSKYDFCPYCGNLLKTANGKEWGMLGKNDFMPAIDEIKFPKGLNIIFNSLMKNLTKELSELNDKKEKPKSQGISISISMSGNRTPEIKVKSSGVKLKNNKIKARMEKLLDFSNEKLETFMKLPREEPSTNIRRLSNKIIYELNLPKVKSLKDIAILQLENSIEIKAVAKDKSYHKIISIDIPIVNYNLSDEKLVLEFDS